jgi:hypothetical protein
VKEKAVLRNIVVVIGLLALGTGVMAGDRRRISADPGTNKRLSPGSVSARKADQLPYERKDLSDLREAGASPRRKATTGAERRAQTESPTSGTSTEGDFIGWAVLNCAVWTETTCCNWERIPSIPPVWILVCHPMALAAMATVLSTRRQGREAVLVAGAGSILAAMVLGIVLGDDEVQVVGKVIERTPGRVVHILQVEDGGERIDLDVTESVWAAFQIGQGLPATRRDGRLESVSLIYSQPPGFPFWKEGRTCC